LKGLELNRSTFDSFDELLDLVYAFPLLERLALRSAEWDSSARSPSAPRDTVPRHLRSLTLEDCDKRRVLDWLISEKRMANLNSIHLLHITPEETKLTGNLLKRLGPSLSHLELVFSFATQDETLSRDIDLSHNNELRTLRTHCLIYSPQTTQRKSTIVASRELDLIPQITSPYVTEVTVDLSLRLRLLNHHGAFDCIDWARMDQTFAKEQFSKLHTLKFVGDKGDVDRAGGEPLIHRRMPKASARGILRFNFVPGPLVPYP